MFEINLVPDVKAELLKAQKMRKFVIYISILVAAICIGVIVLLGIIVGGQGIALVAQDNDMERKSNQILDSENLNLNLTIQNQLNQLNEIGNNRRVLSRIFGILDVILPTGENTVRVSELSVNLPNSTLSFDGQADSTTNNNYAALEVFKKTVELSYYDYGRYIDEDGNEIPAVCITEITEDNTIYGTYHRYPDGGCGPAPTTTLPEPENNETDETTDETDEDTQPSALPTLVKIKRNMTASQLEDAKSNNKPYFQSECISGNNNSCPLVEEPVLIRDSSNGRNSAGALVLRFSTVITISPEVFSFNNKHMLLIGPHRQNVTDSYLQVRNMFTEEAEDCAVDDLECINAEGGN